MPADEGLAYISLPRCGSKLARSSTSSSTNSLLIPWLDCPSCAKRESCDKNVIMPLRGEMAGWKKAKPEASRAGVRVKWGPPNLGTPVPIFLVIARNMGPWGLQNSGDMGIPQ